MTPSETATITVGDGDILLTTQTQGPGFGQEETANPQEFEDERLEEDAELEFEYEFDGTTFKLATTLAESFSAMQTLYLLYGSEGISRFFRQNELEPRTVRTGSEYLSFPAEYFLGDQANSVRLLRRAAELLRRNARDAVKGLQPGAKNIACKRLAQARAQIEAETTRYFDFKKNVGVVLSEADFPLGFRRWSADVVMMVNELRNCRDLWKKAAAARTTHQKEYQRQFSELEGKYFPALGPRFDRPVNLPPSIRQEIDEQVRRNPEVQRLAQRMTAENEALSRYMLVAGGDFPVLWRLYDRDDVEFGKDAVRKAAFEELRNAYRANLSLVKDLDADPELVWRFAPVINEAITSHNVPRMSIAWAASQERMEKEHATRPAQAIATVIGLASFSVFVAGAALGIALISPPVLIALFVAEAVLSVIDAIQEIQTYLTHSAAFDAVLNPSLALANEPSWFSTVLTVVFDLAALIPPV